ncbi:MAG: chemotaxis protein CheA [Chlorobi bacterium]|nr:chemotaxis protein CheA [Chlorobiota bacterium]
MNYPNELLNDFTIEARELIANVDEALVLLEKDPENRDILNKVYRWFHTIKGGAGFVNATTLVELCHNTENIFDKLRNGQLKLTSSLLDVVLQSTAYIHRMIEQLASGEYPTSADPSLISRLAAILDNQLELPDPIQDTGTNQSKHTLREYHAILTPANSRDTVTEQISDGKDKDATSSNRSTSPSSMQIEDLFPHSLSKHVNGETTMRVETTRLDYVLNLSGEIGLIRNRLISIRGDILGNRATAVTYKALDEAVGLLDVLVTDLQNAVMKTRMQPIGRLFQKFPRIVRDTARQLGREVDLIIEGAETELDKTMIEELGDPLMHLLRNAIDHGIESPEERSAAGKTIAGTIRLHAEQTGDQIHITIADDGRGIDPEKLRQSATRKGLLSNEAASSLDDKQALQLIFMPGFSTKEQVSDISGRGVGMDVVRTNIARLNGKIDIESIVGNGTAFHITLPLTLAILPVLIVKSNSYPIALPLTVVREIIPINSPDIHEVSGKATMQIRDEVLPLIPLEILLGWQLHRIPRYGIVIHVGDLRLVIGIEEFVGRDDVVIKPVQGLKVRGIAGATLSGEGDVILIVDIEELLNERARPLPMAELLASAPIAA